MQDLSTLTIYPTLHKPVIFIFNRRVILSEKI